MRATVFADREVDPKVTEEFLMTQESVVDASVWLDRGRLRAHVTLAADARWNRESLRRACASQVGTLNTPEEFLFLPHRTRRA
jgi:hypothetical protein